MSGERLSDMDFFKALKKDYSVQGVIGDGGSVLLLHAHRRSDGREVAIKVVPKVMSSMVDAEVDVRQNTSSDRIVKLVQVIEDADSVFVVMEHVAGANLLRILRQRKGGLSELDALRVARGVLEALVQLHSAGMAHRALGLGHIILVDEDPDQVQLVDFGQAYSRHSSSNFVDAFAAPEYRPPEMTAERPCVPEEIDMWQLGVVLYALIAAKMPFASSSLETLYRAIRASEPRLDGAAWGGVSAATKELIRDLLSKCATRRPTAGHCLKVVQDILRGARAEGQHRGTGDVKRGAKVARFDASERVSTPPENVGSFEEAFMDAFDFGTEQLTAPVTV